MSYIAYDKSGRSELDYDVSGKHKLQDENKTELKSNLTIVNDQTKLLRSKINFIENNFNYSKETILNTIEEMRKAKFH